MKSPSALRQEYTRGILCSSDLQEDPILQFETWFEAALTCEAILEPNAMTLSTASRALEVTSRIVLLKGYDKNGFRFFTNTTSLKGRQMAENPNVSLLFFWPPLERQVKISGRAVVLAREETVAYFHSRPRNSQLAAWASFQSSPLASRSFLEDRMEHLQNKFAHQEIPVPEFWNGYLVEPHSIEFWQGRSNRLHDCFRYTKKEDTSWAIERLNP